MNDALVIVASFLGGAVLGAAWLLGLWWTVRRVAATGNRGLLAGSFLVRAGLLLLGFYGILQLGPWSLLAALAGFLITRMIVTGIVRGGGGTQDDTVA